MATIHEGEAPTPAVSTVSTTSQSYKALVWRRSASRCRDAWAGAGVRCSSSSRSSPSSSPPRTPTPTRLFRAADKISFYTKDGFTLWPVVYAITESEELDPITFQPLMGPDLDNPRPLAFFVEGWEYNFLGLIPMDTHFIGLADGTPLRLLGTDSSVEDVLSRGIIGSRISLTIALTSITLITIAGTLLGITSGYIGAGFDMWFQRFVEIVLASPQLPLYLTLTP